jgi:hypothetical protein
MTQLFTAEDQKGNFKNRAKNKKLKYTHIATRQEVKRSVCILHEITRHIRLLIGQQLE